MKWFTTRDAASLLGLPPSRVRAYVRAGILQPYRGPRNEYRFSFQDLVLLRAAAGLQAARIPPRRIQQALDRLRTQLPQGRSLSELRIVAEDDRIVVYDGGTAWNPLSGQYHLDFTVAELGATVSHLATRATREAEEAGDEMEADDWYELGVDLEAYAPAEARHAYERAIAMDPRHADAHVNLGRILHDGGEVAAAEAHYRRAMEGGPHATASFNLGVALEDQGRNEEAEQAYRCAVLWDGDLAEAHYNLARLLENRGDPQSAIRHLALCKRILEARRGREGATLV